jgi:hypothetical protein
MEDDFIIQLKLPSLWHGNSLGTVNFLFGLFGGGGGGTPAPPPVPELDPRGKEFQSELYPMIQSGLEGQGLTPGITGQSMRELLSATQGGFEEAHRGMTSMMERTIPKADLKVREFISNSLNAEFARQKQGVREEFEMQPFEDVQRAQTMAFGAVGGERRMGTAITSLYNQSALRQAYAPSFASGLAGGLGGAAGMLIAGPIGYGREFTKFG